MYLYAFLSPFFWVTEFSFGKQNFIKFVKLLLGMPFPHSWPALILIKPPGLRFNTTSWETHCPKLISTVHFLLNSLTRPCTFTPLAFINRVPWTGQDLSNHVIQSQQTCKGPIVNVSGFSGHRISTATIHFCYCSIKAATDNT